MKIETKQIQSAIGEVVYVNITNASGASVTLSSLGARIAAVSVPDRRGNFANVVIDVIDSDNIFFCEPYAKEFANFARHIWDFEIINDDEVQFSCSTTIEDNPHSVALKASYRWTEDNVLELYLTTPNECLNVFNPAGQTYFNLENDYSAKILDEYLWLNADRYALVSEEKYAIKDVKDSALDFTKAKQLRQDIDALTQRECNDSIYWLINDWEKGLMNEAAVLASHSSGRQLSIFTTLPIVRVHTIAGCDDAIVGNCSQYSGITIECGNNPNVEDRSISTHQTDEENTDLIFFKFSTF